MYQHFPEKQKLKDMNDIQFSRTQWLETQVHN